MLLLLDGQLQPPTMRKTEVPQEQGPDQILSTPSRGSSNPSQGRSPPTPPGVPQVALRLQDETE